MKKILTIILTIFVAFFNGCSNKNEKNSKPLVAVSTFAIYDVTKHIAKEDVDVFLLLPPGKEVHSFEPTPKDIIKIKKASLFIYNGAGLEPWCEKFSSKNSLDLSKYVTLKDFDKSHHHHIHNEHTKDPHYWLDFSNMKKIADTITNKLSKISPQKKEIFKKRATNYKKMLDELDTKFSKELSICKNKEIFVNHNAYSYLASRYGFEVHSLVGLSSQAQPNPKTIQKIIKEIKEKGIKVIFFENFENSSVLKMIAKDTGVSLETLQPLANLTADEAKKHLTYKDIMLQNLKKLKKALSCH